MNIEQKLNIVSRNTDEIITLSELKTLLETKSRPRAYWGFECSGFMHIGMGLVVGGKIKDMVSAGFEFIIFLADWHSWINNKLGGDMNNIRICGEYFKDCFTALGVSPEKVRYIWASELAGDREYWEKVIRVGKLSSLHRIWRALPIMGRSMENADVDTATMIYPCMQAADIFHMDLDVACRGDGSTQGAHAGERCCRKSWTKEADMCSYAASHRAKGTSIYIHRKIGRRR